MKFSVDQAIEILKQTPPTLDAMLKNLSPEWTESGGDHDNWGPYDVVGHLIHGEETDWIPRAEIILAQAENRTFVPFDRLAQFEISADKPLPDLLTEFAQIRESNIEKLIGWRLTPAQLELTGMHPELGEVTLEQLLATWVVHDLNHVRQIVTCLAKAQAENVGPWKQYLSIIN